MPSYSELLKDPRWQRVRLKKMEAAEWSCQRCYDRETMLSVHHKRYVKGRAPWEYDEQELVVLCQSCHEEMHPQMEARGALLARLDDDGPRDVDAFMAIGAGWVSGWVRDDATLVALIDEYRWSLAFDAGRFVANLSNLGIARHGLRQLADLTDADQPAGTFLDELFELLRRHGIRMLGDPPTGAASP